MKKLSASTIYVLFECLIACFLTTIFTATTLYRIQVIGMTPFQLVFVGTVLELAAFLFEVPTGVLADTYSRRLSVIIGTCLLGVGALIEGLLPFFIASLAAQLVWGLGYTFLSGATEAWVADEVGEAQAGPAYLRAAQYGQVGSLAGMGICVALATIQLNLPILCGGAAIVALAGVLALVMPERGFSPLPPAERGSWRALLDTFRQGVRAVRGSPLLIAILVIAIFLGASSEAFDRLWQAHMLANIPFPASISMQPISWFALMNAGSMIIAFVATAIMQRLIDVQRHQSVTRALLLLTLLLAFSVTLLTLASSFALALVALWSAGLMRKLIQPLYTAWINQHVSSETRATVLSISGQADALGQVTGGPLIGAAGSLASVRAALALSGLFLAPAVGLLWRILRREPAAEASEAQRA